MRIAVFLAPILLCGLARSTCSNSASFCSQSCCGVDGVWRDRHRSCADIKHYHPYAGNGLYEIHDEKGSVYRTYCDMKTGGGGWTLVASVHEDFMGGKCVTGDKWSSEHGNNAAHPHGDGNWENTNTFGAPESATSDDYKNPGYFNMEAKNIMIWHVPNGAPVDDYEEDAFMMYHTDNDFLGNHGGNLYRLFKQYYPLRHNEYAPITDHGPSPPVVWDRGSDEIRIQNTPPKARAETVPGYIQFRAINNERSAFAICPGLKTTGGNVEHVCVGGTSNHQDGEDKLCGDFSSYDWNGYGTGLEWSANRLMTESVVMIFYR